MLPWCSHWRHSTPEKPTGLHIGPLFEYNAVAAIPAACEQLV
jgi:hypothetical protein